jgi:hypothetical protein
MLMTYAARARRLLVVAVLLSCAALLGGPTLANSDEAAGGRHQARHAPARGGRAAGGSVELWTGAGRSAGQRVRLDWGRRGSRSATASRGGGGRTWSRRGMRRV